MMVFHFCGRERNFAQRSIRNRSWQIEGKNDYERKTCRRIDGRLRFRSYFFLLTCFALAQMAPVRPRRSRFLRRMKRNLRFSTSKKPCLDTSAPPGAERSRHRTPEGTAETADQRRICSPDLPALVGTADPRTGNRTDHARQAHRAACPGTASGRLTSKTSRNRSPRIKPGRAFSLLNPRIGRRRWPWDKSP